MICKCCHMHNWDKRYIVASFSMSGCYVLPSGGALTLTVLVTTIDALQHFETG